MITALVQFNLPAAMTPEQAREVFLSTAPAMLRRGFSSVGLG